MLQVLPQVPTKTHPSVNGEAILRVADAIEGRTIPGFGFNMDIIYGNDVCGSVGCIGGWNHVVHHPTDVRWATGWKIMHQAAHDLGLDDQRAAELMNPAQCDCDYNVAIYRATPEQAAACMRHLAYTGEVRWDLFVDA